MEPSTVPIPTTVLAHNIAVLPSLVVCLAVRLHELVQAKAIMWACSRSHGFVDWRNGLRIKSLPSAHKRFIKHHLFFLSLAPLYTSSWPKQVMFSPWSTGLQRVKVRNKWRQHGYKLIKRTILWLFWNSFVQISGVNFVDDNMVLQCQKVEDARKVPTLEAILCLDSSTFSRAASVSLWSFQGFTYI